MDLLVTVVHGINKCHKNSILDVAGVADLPLSLLGKVFQRYLSVRHMAQLVTHGKTVKTPTIYRQVLIVVDKSCRFFFHQLRIGVLENICSKILM